MTNEMVTYLYIDLVSAQNYGDVLTHMGRCSHTRKGMFSHMRLRSQCQFGTFLYVILDVTTSGDVSHLMCRWDMFLLCDPER